MEKLVKDGLVKSIGVSNYSVALLADLLTYATIKPAVNQVELHPYLSQQGLYRWCTEKGIHLTAYSPLGRPGQHRTGAPLLEDEVLVKIAKKVSASPAQVLIKWGIQRGISIIPKSSTPARIKENLGSVNVELSKEDVAALDGLNKNLRYVNIILSGPDVGKFGPAGVTLFE